MLASSYVLTCLVAWAIQDRLIYLPDRTVPLIEATLPGARQVSYSAPGGPELIGWYLPAALRPSGRTPPTAVVFHGNATNRAANAPLAATLSAGGFNVLLAEYRGFGESDGSPSEDGLTADGLAAVTTATDLGATRAEDLVIVGTSLGTGVALNVATRQPPNALVLFSPFTSLRDAAWAQRPGLPYQWLMRDNYDNESAVRSLDVPVYVFTGTLDPIVPVEQSKAVFDAARRPAQYMALEGGTHVDPALFTPESLVKVLELAGAPG